MLSPDFTVNQTLLSLLHLPPGIPEEPHFSHVEKSRRSVDSRSMGNDATLVPQCDVKELFGPRIIEVAMYNTTRFPLFGPFSTNDHGNLF